MKNLEKDLIKFIPSKIERPKSFINIDIIDRTINEPILELYTESENLIDGSMKMKCNLFTNKIKDETIIDSINLFLNLCFDGWPIIKVYFEAYQNEKKLIKNLMKIGFSVEADLKEDFFFEGKYIDKIILAKYKN